MKFKPSVVSTAAALALLATATVWVQHAAETGPVTTAGTVPSGSQNQPAGSGALLAQTSQTNQTNQTNQESHGHTNKAALPAMVGATAAAPALATAATALAPAAQASHQLLVRLGQLPAGDAALALAQQLESSITPQNTAGYLQALLQTSHPTVERATIAALARAGDSSTMQTLAQAYGSLQPEQRGRVLQVFENAANPNALQGLTALFAADRSEKRSALVVSALVGVAHIGTMESVQYLLSQVTPANADYALHALDRVRSLQGLEMIKAAASGSKDAALIDNRYLPALKRLAEARGSS